MLSTSKVERSQKFVWKIWPGITKTKRLKLISKNINFLVRVLVWNMERCTIRIKKSSKNPKKNNFS
jgi:hypothetical protein